jgi:hypothetical protein
MKEFKLGDGKEGGVMIRRWKDNIKKYVNV